CQLPTPLSPIRLVGPRAARNPRPAGRHHMLPGRNMNAAFALPALRGDNPLGFLAALGVIEVVTSAGDDIQLSWTAPSSPAVITSSTVRGLDDLAERLGHNSRPSFSATIDPHAERLTPAALRPSLLRAQTAEIADRQTQWLTS